jgi:glycosyltransferase involved in cell wall biosynthesis
MNERPYVLVTAARDEESFIGKTIEAVASQTVLPRRWVIVNDGSQDRTAEIVMGHAAELRFIKLVNTRGRSNRDYASKVGAIRLGIRHLGSIDYEFIGNLDADITFDRDYYEKILSVLRKNDKLGLAGGFVFEKYCGQYRSRFGNTVRSVPGGVQMFRRQCFEDIGGYVPLRYGCEDAAAEIAAREKGWQVKSFPAIEAYHLRATGTASVSYVGAAFRQGAAEYLLGYHPVYELAKCLRRSVEKPYFIGSIARAVGYVCCLLRGHTRSVPEDIVRHLRTEQMSRVKSHLFGNWRASIVLSAL